MNDLQKEFEATGYTSWINSDLYPDGKIYTQEYTHWLEKRVQSLSMSGVTGQIEQLVCDVCEKSKNQEYYTICHDCHIDSIQ